MKPRYNLRTQPIKQNLGAANKKARSILVSRVKKSSKFRPSKSIKSQQTKRRQSLRLTPVAKPARVHETTPKWRHIENEHQDEDTSVDSEDNYDDLLARHHRHMLEEQKDRKLYERYVRGQRSLRRLQCRRTHTAHLSEATRHRLLRELERERRYAIEDKVCSYLSNHRITFQHGCNIESKQPITWSTLEEEVPYNRNEGTIHQLDVMINNLKRVIHNAKSSISKPPRLSVRERQNQRLVAGMAAATTSNTTNKPDSVQTKELNTSVTTSNSTVTLSPQQITPSCFLRVPVVRFSDNQNTRLQTSNSQHLTCIQNVLLHHNNDQTSTNNHHRCLKTEASTNNSSRKSVLRSQVLHANASDSSIAKKRPLEKENYSVTSNSSTNLNTVLKTATPMVSIKYTSSSASSRSYPNTRKHPIMSNSFTTRRHTRLS